MRKATTTSSDKVSKGVYVGRSGLRWQTQRRNLSRQVAKNDEHMGVDRHHRCRQPLAGAEPDICGSGKARLRLRTMCYIP